MQKILYVERLILQDTAESASLQAKHQAVLLRESGLSASEVAKTVGLSAPTVLALHRAFKAGGWDAVDQRTRGRPRLPNSSAAPQAIVDALVGLLPEQAQLGPDTAALWSFDSLAQWLGRQNSTATSRKSAPLDRRSVQRRLGQWGWLPNAALGVPRKAQAMLQAGTHSPGQPGIHLLWARDARGALWWLLLAQPPTDSDYRDFAQRLLQ